MTVTVVEGGTQHNVIPDTLHFIIDVRTNEFYQNEYLFNFLCKKMTKCELRARSFRLHSSSISPDHPIVKRFAHTERPGLDAIPIIKVGTWRFKPVTFS